MTTDVKRKSAIAALKALLGEAGAPRPLGS